MNFSRRSVPIPSPAAAPRAPPNTPPTSVPIPGNTKLPIVAPIAAPVAEPTNTSLLTPGVFATTESIKSMAMTSVPITGVGIGNPERIGCSSSSNSHSFSVLRMIFLIFESIKDLNAAFSPERISFAQFVAFGRTTSENTSFTICSLAF